MLPFQGSIIAGTTDAPCPVTPRPQATGDEVAFILDAISDFLQIKVCHTIFVRKELLGLGYWVVVWQVCSFAGGL
jgi:glycerol-3-phosphate dehydrogenase